MNIKPIASALLLALPMCAFAEGTSPWLPIPGQAALTANYTDQSADSAYIGDKRLAVKDITGGGASHYKRTSTNLRLDYGLTDALALDVSLSHGKTTVGGADRDSGMTDSVVGLRWRVLDEFENPHAPTLTLRGAAILKGSYDGARLAALGKDANGVEVSATLGKQITSSFALWGELGVRNYSNHVPNASFYELGARLQLAPAVSASLGYSSKRFSSDLDIGGQGFSPARFQEVKEERDLVKLGVGFSLARNQSLALNWAKVVSGRNTVKDDRIVGLSYTFAFN